MKKIAIITLTRNPNFGNFLQNFAMQLLLKQYNTEPETIINYTHSTLFVKQGIKQKLKTLFRKQDKNLESRRQIFISMWNKYITCSNISYQNGKFNKDDLQKYDYFIAGSDQVWNPYFGVATEYEFLTFAPEEKRLSYAASFGVETLNTAGIENIEKIKEGLENLSVISVREKAGAKLVKEYSGREAFVHLDPTMLITTDVWNEYIYKPEILLEENYVFIYVLGKLTEKYKKLIQRLEHKYQGKVINVLSPEYSAIDPYEFVWMIKNAKCICTDSFHAAVFSILYHKELYVFEREDNHENQSSRFDTLFEKCGIEGNRLSSTVNEKDRVNINWNSVESLLTKERKLSEEYFNKILQ